jgi:hypothetical protein
MTPLTVFTWGYEGWGSSTPQFKQLVDIVEQERGYAKPLFVDLRFHRNGRAIGFKGDEFDRVLGKGRYRWMNALGNRQLNATSGPSVELNDPTAIEELLGLALARSAKGQRTIMFCSCGLPRQGDRVCHRVAVATLLLKLAARRNVALTIAEWPGGEVKTIAVPVNNEQAVKVRAGAANINLGPRRPSAALLAMPWRSVAQLKAADFSARAIVDPPIFRGDRWLLPLPFFLASERATLDGIKKRSRTERRRSGLDPRRS